MSHYYTNEPTKDVPGQFQFELNHRQYTLATNAGVFSKDKLDEGTRILLKTVLEEGDGKGPVLDMGCGIGPVSKVMATEWKVPVTAIDVNEKAVQLARQNTGGLDVTCQVNDGLRDIDTQFANILINPPIRTGKKTVYRLLEECAHHLNKEGSLWIVMRKQHGAQSAVTYLESLGLQVQRAARSMGYWILKVTKPQED